MLDHTGANRDRERRDSLAERGGDVLKRVGSLRRRNATPHPNLRSLTASYGFPGGPCSIP